MAEGQSALTKISRAIDRGTLRQVSVDTCPSGALLFVGVEIKDEPSTRRAGRRWMHEPSNPATLAWFERNFPGGSHRVRHHGGRRATRSNPNPGLDRMEYRTPQVTVRYSAPHAHPAFTSLHTPGETGLDWKCVSCSTELSAGEARALGLPTRVEAAR